MRKLLFLTLFASSVASAQTLQLDTVNQTRADLARLRQEIPRAMFMARQMADQANADAASLDAKVREYREGLAQQQPHRAPAPPKGDPQ